MRRVNSRVGESSRIAERSIIPPCEIVRAETVYGDAFKAS